jgi:hypothetical protein
LDFMFSSCDRSSSSRLQFSASSFSGMLYVASASRLSLLQPDLMRTDGRCDWTWCSLTQGELIEYLLLWIFFLCWLLPACNWPDWLKPLLWFD